MKKENRMEQHYALSQNKKLTHINIAHESNEDFFCPNCGCKMIKKCGPKRTWHFAHNYKFADIEQHQCSYESYLHGYCKYRLKQWFEESKSIILHYKQKNICRHLHTCIWRNAYNYTCFEKETKQLDLKKVYTNCEVEKWVVTNENSFRADLLLFDEKDLSKRMLLEVKVSSNCSNKKKISGEKIIEFEIKNEEDVDYIVNNDIIESETILFFGINEENNQQYKAANIQLTKFIFYSSGKAYSEKKCNCQDYQKRNKNSSLIEITIPEKSIDAATFHMYGLSVAQYNGINVQNCLICSHCKYDKTTDSKTCMKKGDSVKKGDDALNCVYTFELNNKVCQNKLNDFNIFCKSYQV
ncbi:MAG: hypothetical protein HUJ68_13535, partial [Clostridia bacterium]|nr:hypothetical protein [Clostridia bacterium]